MNRLTVPIVEDDVADDRRIRQRLQSRLPCPDLFRMRASCEAAKAECSAQPLAVADHTRWLQALVEQAVAPLVEFLGIKQLDRLRLEHGGLRCLRGPFALWTELLRVIRSRS